MQCLAILNNCEDFASLVGGCSNFLSNKTSIHFQDNRGHKLANLCEKLFHIHDRDALMVALQDYQAYCGEHCPNDISVIELPKQGSSKVAITETQTQLRNECVSLTRNYLNEACAAHLVVVVGLCIVTYSQMRECFDVETRITRYRERLSKAQKNIEKASRMIQRGIQSKLHFEFCETLLEDADTLLNSVVEDIGMNIRSATNRSWLGLGLGVVSAAIAWEHGRKFYEFFGSSAGVDIGGEMGLNCAVAAGGSLCAFFGVGIAAVSVRQQKELLRVEAEFKATRKEREKWHGKLLEKYGEEEKVDVCEGETYIP